jgi:hypothetical protein
MVLFYVMYAQVVDRPDLRRRGIVSSGFYIYAPVPRPNPGLLFHCWRHVGILALHNFLNSFHILAMSSLLERGALLLDVLYSEK